MKRFLLLTTTALGLAVLLLYRCRDTTEVTGPGELCAVGGPGTILRGP